MKQVEEFSKRLDKIFNEGNPTKALIIDGYIKTNPTAQKQVKNNDLLHNVSKRCPSFEEIDEKAKEYSKQFKVLDSPIETEIIQGKAERDFKEGFKQGLLNVC